MNKKKIITNCVLSALLVVGIASTCILTLPNPNDKVDDPIDVEVVNKGIVVKKLNSSTNQDGSITQTFTFSVEPEDATSDLVKVDVTYKDGSPCNDVLTATVDNDNNIISVTCKNAFSQQIILTVTALSDDSVSASVNIDYLQRWPIATAKNEEDLYDKPFMIGTELNGDDVNYFPEDIVDFTSLFDIDYGVYSKAKTYSYSGISSDGTITGKVVDLSNTISEEMKEKMVKAAWTLLCKMNNEKLSWSKELIWNLIDTNEYKTALYNSMVSYDYEDCSSYIELEYTRFDLMYKDEEETELTIGTLDKVKFRINICSDYSSLTNGINKINLQLEEILF